MSDDLLFRAFDTERLTHLLAVPPHWEVFTMTAVGMAAPDAERGPRAGARTPSVAWPREPHRTVESS